MNSRPPQPLSVVTSRLRLTDRDAQLLEFAAEHRLVLSAHAQALLECSQKAIVADAVLAQSNEQALALWRIRELVPEAQLPATQYGRQ